MITGHRHVGLTVSDLPRSLEFYQNVLGLVLLEERQERGGYIDSLTGVKDIVIQWAKVGTVGGGLLFELQYIPTHPEGTRRQFYPTPGINHYCMNVEDLGALYNSLQRKRVPCSPMQEDPGGMVWNFTAKDPDGTILEFVEVCETAAKVPEPIATARAIAERTAKDFKRTDAGESAV